MIDAIEMKRSSQGADLLRHDWDRQEAEALYELPFADLMFRAQGIDRTNFDPNHIETASFCSASRPGAARRIAATARKARITTPE